MEVLAALARGNESVIPENGFIDIPARSIRKDNVEEFSARLKELTSTDKPDEPEEQTTEEPAAEELPADETTADEAPAKEATEEVSEEKAE